MISKAPIFAIVTPFTAHGDMDFGALRAYLQFLGNSGISTIIVGGTTGEFASLTLAERSTLLEHCRRDFAGTLIAHVSSCCVQDSWTLLDHAAEHADAALVLPPFYYARPQEAGVTAFFVAVAKRSKLPVYLYNFPEHTQFVISPLLLQATARECDTIAGIKDSGGDLEISKAYKSISPQLQVFVGSDRRALKVLESGLNGSVTGAGNPMPEAFAALAREFRAGRRDMAQAGQTALDRWTSFRERLPLAEVPLTKAALSGRIPGFPAFVRPPFVMVDETMAAQIRDGIRDCASGA